MNGSEMLEVLTRAGAHVARSHDGRVVALGLPPELRPLLDEHRTDLTLAIAGQSSGHRWASCTTCHRPQLIPTGSEQGCKLKPRCKGKLKAYAKARAVGEAIELDGQPVPCARPGCDRPAVWRTAWHELVCSADFHHLALLATPREETPR